jgi:PAS domain S-box-containing protein
MKNLLNIDQHSFLLDSLPDAVIVTDLQFHIQSWNTGAAILYGWEAAEVVGKNVSTVIPLQHITISRDQAGESLFGQGYYEGEVIHTCRDGRRLNVWTKVTLVRNEAGDPIGVIALNRDITALRQAEQALTARLQMEQFIVEMAARFINLPANEVDAGIDDTLRLAAEQAGATRSSVFLFHDELTRMTNSHEWCAEAADSQKAQVQNLLVRELHMTMMRFAAGENLIISRPQDVADIPGLNEWMATSGFRAMLFVPMFYQGTLVGALGFYGPKNVEMVWPDTWVMMLTLLTTVIVNALQRKKGDQQQEAYAAELERSNNELQEFAYVASHDLREPLRKILAFSKRLRLRHGEQLDERGMDYLERLERSTARMQMLLDGLLQYSRLQTQIRPFRPVNLMDVVGSVVADLEVQVEQANGRVHIQPLPTIEANATQMRQLFQNLIGNALKFYRPDVPPVVEVQGQQVHVNGRDLIEIRVTDNGIGFDPRHNERIFGVFQRLHGPAEYEGSGLGLAICRKIVMVHFGHISAHSEPGKGATFIVQLPLTQLPAGEKMI